MWNIYDSTTPHKQYILTNTEIMPSNSNLFLKSGKKNLFSSVIKSFTTSHIPPTIINSKKPQLKAIGSKPQLVPWNLTHFLTETRLPHFPCRRDESSVALHYQMGINKALHVFKWYCQRLEWEDHPPCTTNHTLLYHLITKKVNSVYWEFIYC